MSRYDGLIIPRSYSEYINKTDAATIQQALQLSGVLSAIVAAGDNKAVKSSAVNKILQEKRIGEIYNSNGYWKVSLKGYYARPIVIKCIGTSGLYDIAMFGDTCSANLIRLGNTSTKVGYKYTNPSSSGDMGYLFINSDIVNIAHIIFSIDTYAGGLVGTLEESTAEEYNNATNF